MGGCPDPNVACFLTGLLPNGALGCAFNTTGQAILGTANPFFQPSPALGAQAIIAPASIDPVAQAYIKAGLIPTSSSPDGAATFQNPLTDKPDEWTGKVDYEASARDHFTATLGRINDPQLNPGPGGIPGYGSSSTLYSRFAYIAYIRTFSPNLLNE